MECKSALSDVLLFRVLEQGKSESKVELGLGLTRPSGGPVPEGGQVKGSLTSGAIS